MKTTPREGDYVRTAGMTIPQYHAVAKVFIDAGFESGEYPGLRQISKNPYFGISKGRLFHGNTSFDDGRELSLSALLGDRQSMAEFLGTVPTIESILKDSDASWSGEGLPPVGAECEFSYVKSIHGGWLKCKVDFVGKGAVVITTENDSEICVFKDELKFRPLKSEREIAIEEMLCATEKVAFLNSLSAEDAFGIVYDLGYRKVDK